MRLPGGGKGYFSEKADAAFSRVETAFGSAMKIAALSTRKNVMTSSGRIIEVESFDPENVVHLFQCVCDSLSMKGWTTTGPQQSSTDDLKRSYLQAHKKVQNRYRISGYFGIQFHELPYYRADSRIPEIQKQLELLAEKAAPLFGEMNSAGNKVIQEELNRQNLDGLGFEELFAKMFDDDQLLDELNRARQTVENDFAAFHAIKLERDVLYGELGKFVIQVHQTSAVQIDYNRLMAGEEGIVAYFDIERIKNRKTDQSEANFDTSKVPEADTDEICRELDSCASALSGCK